MTDTSPDVPADVPVADAGSNGSDSTSDDTLTRVRRSTAGTLMERMGIEILEASADRLVGAMPVAGNTQPYGLLHGGASVVLAETLGSYGAMLHAGEDRQAVGIEVSATHHRAATGGVVTGTARALHLGGTLASYEIVVEDERGRRICTARLTCVLVPRRDG
jgi:1,4-dihydroxy-2-naphthoyl-CoA hydrolase